MQIHVHYTGDPKRTFRMITYVQRRRTDASRAIGALVLLGAVLIGATGGSVYVVLFLAVFGVLTLVMPNAGLWWAVRRNRELMVRDVDVEVTDRGITRRTATVTTQARWEQVQRVLETDDFWIFVINRLQWVGLYKSHLTPDQRAELAAFLATRPWEATEDQT
jgi:hypothetical protein